MRKKRTIVLSFLLFAFLPLLAFAQSSDGSAGGAISAATDTTSVATTSADSGAASGTLDPSASASTSSVPSDATSSAASTTLPETPAPAPDPVSTGLIPVRPLTTPAASVTPVSAFPQATDTASTTAATTSMLDDAISELPPKAPGFDYIPLTIVAVLFVLCAVVVFMLWRLLRDQSDDDDDQAEDRCGTIKEALEVKKKELEDMIRDWPEEKLKEIIEEKTEEKISKGKRGKKAVDIYEDVRERYEQLTNAIELLEEKWNVCLLELPEWRGGGWKGVIVENSLRDKKILDDFKIVKTSKDADWTVHAVIGDDKGIDRMKEKLVSGAWYALFWKPSTNQLAIVFKDRRFDLKRDDKNTWEPAIAYGVSLGIPAKELNFDPD